jgi:hypothetical protein
MNAIPTASVYGLSSALFVFAWILVDRKNRHMGNLLYVVLGITLISFLLPRILKAEGNLVPWKYDELLYRLDNAAGLSIVGIARVTPYWLYAVVAVVYKSLPWSITFWAGMHLSRPWGEYGAMSRAFLNCYATTGPLFLILPACGPSYALQHFRGSTDPFVLADLPNAIPSMHICSAFLLLIFAGPTARWQRILMLYLLGTAAGTILVGEHYFVDWLPAIPFAFFGAFAARRQYRRAALNLAVTLSLILMLRFAGPSLIAHPAVLWLLSAATACLGAHQLRIAWPWQARLHATLAAFRTAIGSRTACRRPLDPYAGGAGQGDQQRRHTEAERYC